MPVESFDAGPDTNTVLMHNGIGPDYFQALVIPLMSAIPPHRASRIDPMRALHHE